MENRKMKQVEIAKRKNTNEKTTTTTATTLYNKH